MKVYVVIYNGLDNDQHIEKVFSAGWDAEAYVKEKGPHSAIHSYDIESYDLEGAEE